jgi:hypothetical protein
MGVGGLVGISLDIDTKGTITNCYATGSVSGSSWVGGLVGHGGTIANCYSTGSVSGSGGGRVGGGATVYGSFWDVETSGLSTSAGGEGKTTAEMKDVNTYLYWGCGMAWTIDDGVDYPHLMWENQPGQIISSAKLSDFVGGAGTESEPYLIYTAEELNLIGLFWCEFDKHFKLMADIDLSGYTGTSFNIIGFPFSGVFDGSGHKIFNFTYTYSTNSPYQVRGIGLFKYVDGPGSEIKDLCLIDPNVRVALQMMVGLSSDVGSLVGVLEDATISGCYVEGGSVSGNNRIGGLVGDSNGIITNCYATGSVSGSSWVGGLVGSNGGEITNCYSGGSVSGDNRVGGLVGEHDYGGRMTYCYSIGSVTAMLYVGGVVGRNEGAVGACLWDTQTSGRSNMCGTYGVGCDDDNGKTTAEMQMPSTFTSAGWDFISEKFNGSEDVWRLCNGGLEYPQLNWKFPVGDLVCPDGVDLIDYSFFAEHWQETDYGDVDGIELSGDGRVNWEDFGLFAEWWMESGCGGCSGADFTGEGDVDYLDLDVLAGYWLRSEYGDCGGAELTGDGEVGVDDLRRFSDNWLEGI